jgi:hypothetical protein
MSEQKPSAKDIQKQTKVATDSKTETKIVII